MAEYLEALKVKIVFTEGPSVRGQSEIGPGKKSQWGMSLREVEIQREMFKPGNCGA